MDKTTSYFLRVFEDAKHYSDERERRLNFIIGAYEDRIRCLQAENEKLQKIAQEAQETVSAFYDAAGDLRSAVRALKSTLSEGDEFCEWEHGKTSCRGTYLYAVKGPCPNCGKIVRRL